MSTPCNAAADAPAPPVAVRRWPGMRHADLIERRLRRLAPARRDALLEAVAATLDRYMAATAQRVGTTCVNLDEELDEVLRCLGSTSGTGDDEGAA